MKKYKIFISGVQKELKKERLAVKEIIINNTALRGFFDIFLFEDLSASGRPLVSIYLRQVDKSDIYIGIIGNEYGVKGKDGFSATEREYRRFIKKNIQGEPLIFIRGRNDLKKDKDVRRLITAIKSLRIYKRFANVVILRLRFLTALSPILMKKGN